ncbi:MAG: hypothetical protein ACREQF_06220, partial [Candidatus Binataceae bacterium]
SCVGEVHLRYGQLYALFDETSETPSEMLGGFAMHDLGRFPQSYPKPDLTHLTPRSVIEYGELWSRAKGAGRLAQRGALVLSGLLQAQALLVYPICKPWDLTGGYNGVFEPTCDPVAWPYARTLGGETVWVQPMVLSGARLQQAVRIGWQMGFETADEHRRIRFDNPFKLSPRLTMSSEEQASNRDEANGAAHA